MIHLNGETHAAVDQAHRGPGDAGSRIAGGVAAPARCVWSGSADRDTNPRCNGN